MKKNVALVFGITENYVFALANTLMGLVENNKKFWDDIIVYCDHIEEKNKNYINSIAECKFFEASELIFEDKIPKEVLVKYSVAAFYRYDCFNLLKEYKTVIWNDVDILIQGDISDLLNYGEKGIALTKNIGNFKVEANFEKVLPDYNMFCQLYNSGIIVYKDTLPNYENLCSWCVEKTLEYAEYLRWPDQGIINIMLQEFDIEPDLIDIEKFCCHPSSKNIKKAKIIHAYGDEKFWNCDNLLEKFPKWNEYNEKWEGLSGIKNKPLVSCIMSTYNRYEHLEEAVKSILNQTYKNIELIVVTEFCENQEKICKMLKSFKDERIVIIKNENRLGFPASLNKGINAANGKYIARMDDDDISLPKRFEKQVKFMEEHQEIGMCGTAAKFFGEWNNEIPAETDSEVLKIKTLFRTPFIHPTVMMRKSMINKYNLRYNPEYFTEDYELWSRAVYKFPVSNINEVLLLYRTGNDKLTGGNNEKKMHSSHKRIMRNQFENELHMNPSENQIELLQDRFDVLNNCYNREEAIKMKKEFMKEIINQNNIYSVYDKEKIKEVFQVNEVVETNNNKFKKSFRGFIKKLLKPFYSKLMSRIQHKIDLGVEDAKEYCDKKIKNLKK